MRTIAVFVKNLTSGGAEKQSVIQAKVLSKNCSVHYIIFNGSKVHDKYLQNLQSEKDVQITSFKGNHLYRFASFVKYLRKNHIEIVFSYLTAANLYACLASLFCKTRIVIGLRNAKLPLNKLIVDKFLTNHVAELAISNSYAGKKEFVGKGFKDERVKVIPNCFENITPYSSKVEHEHVDVVTVGRFVKQKDYETAIAAISLVVIKHPYVKYTIIGYGELEMKIRTWIKEYKIEEYVDLLINPDNIEEHLNQSDIYLCTSLFEGTSNSIMEAMNADLPIVCTDVGDNSKLVYNTINGYVCSVGDTGQIASRVIELVLDKGKRTLFGHKSKEILSSIFGPDIFNERYRLLLNGID